MFYFYGFESGTVFAWSDWRDHWFDIIGTLQDYD